ncbi:hypothetical protein FQZ97_1216940 [compost metagenome]
MLQGQQQPARGGAGHVELLGDVLHGQAFRAAGEQAQQRQALAQRFQQFVFLGGFGFGLRHFGLIRGSGAEIT